MKVKANNRFFISAVAGLAAAVMLTSPKASEASFLFPEITAFPSIAFEKPAKTQKHDKEISFNIKFFIADLFRDIFCTDKD